jgi:hypothetical protein
VDTFWIQRKGAFFGFIVLSVFNRRVAAGVVVREVKGFKWSKRASRHERQNRQEGRDITSH